MIRKKWWEKKAVESSSQWCVIRVESVVIHRPDMWAGIYVDVYKPCHLSNIPNGANLVCKNLTQHEAQAMCKLLNLENEEKLK